MSVCPTCGQRQRTAVDRRASRQAKTSDFDTGRCRACQTPILVGWLGGTLAALDHRPLSEIGVMAARANSEALYQRQGTKFRSYPQTPTQQHPDRPNTVHLKHECTRAWPPPLFLPLIGHEKKKHKSELPDNPPF